MYMDRKSRDRINKAARLGVDFCRFLIVLSILLFFLGGLATLLTMLISFAVFRNPLALPKPVYIVLSLIAGLPLLVALIAMIVGLVLMAIERLSSDI